MTPRDFCIWLEGYLKGKTDISEFAIENIMGKLATVDKTLICDPIFLPNGPTDFTPKWNPTPTHRFGSITCNNISVSNTAEDGMYFTPNFSAEAIVTSFTVMENKNAL